MPKKEGIPPDESRCRRTDGRQWRCVRRVLDGKKLCNIHYLQGRRRQLKQKVPESLKLERKSKKICKGEEKIRASGDSSRSSKAVKMALVKKKKNKKKRCASEVLDEALRKMKLKRGDLHLELIREFLKRQLEKKNQKNVGETDCNVETETSRELPNGVMAISQKNSHNVDGFVGVDTKIGSNSGSGLHALRSFRSKNIEPLPVGTIQFGVFEKVIPSAGYLKRVKKCHWCRRNIGASLIKCLKCRKHFFCGDCIRERYFEKKEIKLACLVCRGTCSCRICSKHSKEINHKEFYRDKRTNKNIELLHYLISMLFPVLKQINHDQRMELDMEAMITGKLPSKVQIQQAELGDKKLYCCNNCETSIVDYHRRCANCSYNLCLSCCWEFCRGNVNQKFKTKGGNKKENCLPADNLQLRMNQNSISSRIPCETPMSLQRLEGSSDGSVVCPPADFGGCGEKNLDLRCIYPLSWLKELEAGAAAILQSYEFPENSNACSCRSLCEGADNIVGEVKKLQKFANRVETNDDFLYCPTLNDLNKEKLGHFQQHWTQGHPVIVQNVIRKASVLKWDPFIMFCTYLEKVSSESRHKQPAVKGSTCLDWCEVEVSAKHIFMGSMAEDTHVNMQHQTMKIKAWLSSRLFQEQFPSHHAEIMHAFPIQEYVNPISGLLNVALKLPPDTRKPEIGPCIHILCGGSEDFMHNDFLTKLCYELNDVVNILAYATDVPISTEQLKKIKILMKKYKDRDHLNSTKKNKVQDYFHSSSNSTEVKGKSSLHGEESESGNLSLDSGDGSGSDSDASILCSGTIEGSEDSDGEHFFRDMESSSSPSEKAVANSCGAQWDIFRRQDVPKLLEYLRRHSDELSASYGCRRRVVHPILDQIFFLDAFHKMRLKEEFDVQPWTFEQHLGEAIMIPAGCPYQVRKLKSCVNIVVDFISPENIAECIRLTDEIRFLPLRHKAREKLLEVRKMTTYGISAAIEDIQRLMCTETDGKACGVRTIQG